MHPSMHGLIVKADYRQFTKLAAAAHFWLLQYAYGDHDSYRL